MIYGLFVILLFSSLFFIVPNSLDAYVPINNKELEKTSLTIFDFKTSRFDGGQPIVFSGKLITDDGTRIPNSEILIKSDHACAADGIIANGMTDKYGKFWIYTMPKKWNPETNLIKIHAEFLGDEKFSSSKSLEKIMVIYSPHTEECEDTLN